MKGIMKSILVFSTAVFLAACSSNKSGWTRLNDNDVDQKSYAIAYGATAQTYADRVNESYDINSFMNGVNDWYTKRLHCQLSKLEQ